MNISARVLRASAADRIPSHPFLTAKERERREMILNTGRTMMAQFGRHAIKMSDFAAAIRLSPATIRSHFCDLDNLLATILREHLMQIVASIGTVTRTTPYRARACRAAYLEATRTGLGAPTESHILLIRDRHLLPEDELASIEAIRDNIGEVLAGEHAGLTLAVLDTAHIHPDRMEAALIALLTNPADPDTAATQPGHAPPIPIAPFMPTIRPLRPHAPPAGRPEWPNRTPWEHDTPLPVRINATHGHTLGSVPMTGVPMTGVPITGVPIPGPAGIGAFWPGAPTAGAARTDVRGAAVPGTDGQRAAGPGAGALNAGALNAGAPNAGAPSNGAIMTEDLRNRAQRRASR